MSDKYQVIQKALFDAMRDEAAQTLGGQGKLNLQSVNTGGVGDFPWFYESQGSFNMKTFSYTNHQMQPDQNNTGAVAFGTTPFTNAYLQLIGAVDFSLSSADNSKLQLAKTNAADVSNTLVSNYQTTYGTITPADIKESGLWKPTKADYIIQYVFGQKFSGNPKGIPYTEMLKAKDLSSLFPKLPPNASPLLATIAQYLNAISSVASLIDLGSASTARLQAIKDAILTPTLENGGIDVVDATGGHSTMPGWHVNESEQSIKKALGNTGTSVSVNLSASQSSNSQLNVSVQGDAGFTVPIDFIEIGVKTSGSYNLQKLSGNSSSIDITATYPGATLVTMSPNEYDVSSGKGWFDGNIINQANANTGKDVTGYRFTSTPPFHLQKGGDFGYLNGLAISQFPTIKMNFAQGDYSSYKQIIKEKTSVDVKLFGVCRVGGGSQSLYKANSEENSSGSGFTVTLDPGPDNYIDAGNVLSNRSFVLGAQVVYPAAS